ncbi:glycosyltransferase [Streptococcus gallolyticus]|uniref:glycosyltransferase family 2 protein n=1 Tax=Streptococcus hepaticus TaxID=3349163 RepID=UPI001C946892|nr:glycosyltransferase [Streptococcus gallolyticus]MBY5041085.1 glycosyltransferase [Streptococcus gallolyticus]
MKPVVSIVCTVYNKAPWLQQTIDSFLNQKTDFPIEIVLIDDCSTDTSREIIASYQEKYPHLIKAFYNEKNLGIARTWVKVCDMVSGDYIARCDGDDYWIDVFKLQKQFDVLQERPESKWSSTDIDFVNETGNSIGQAIFESGQMPKVHSFETMLATRGFMAPSTWLVETALMREVNHRIDLDTADDTFDLQLELFQETKLSYVEDATVAYRVNQGSDSRPKDFLKLENRFNKLLATQNNYLDKYPSSDYREMLRILLDRNNRYELTLTQQSAGLEQLGFERVTIYFDCDHHGFTQENIFQVPLEKKGTVAIHLPDNCQRIRIDLSERPSFYSFVKLQMKSSGTRLLPHYMNGLLLSGNIVFPNPDPQMIYEINTDMYGQDFILSYEVAEMNDIYSEDYIGKVLARGWENEKLLVHNLTHEKVENIQELLTLREVTQQQQADLEEITRLYNSVIHSRRWTIPTKIINFFRRK